MNGFEVMASIIGALFVVGIVTGALLVTVVPRVRRRQASEYSDGAGWREPPERGADDEKLPWWPGR
ncbi:MAG TPA: hypothetical protein VF838_08965 [Trebonia sp.]